MMTMLPCRPVCRVSQVLIQIIVLPASYIASGLIKAGLKLANQLKMISIEGIRAAIRIEK